MSLSRRLEKLEQDLPFVIVRPEGMSLVDLIRFMEHKVTEVLVRPEPEVDKVVKACCDLITDEESDEFVAILTDMIARNPG
jgi:hypothetical protein